MTLYALVFALPLFWPLRRDFVATGMLALVVGTVVGTRPASGCSPRCRRRC
jgi:hypothetical protein